MNNFQGKINTYTCPTCGHRIITIDRDEGVTPMFVRCEGPLRCDRDTLPGATSSMYRVAQTLTPTHEWYRPSVKEMRGLSPSMIHHIRQGGLLIRPIQEPASATT